MAVPKQEDIDLFQFFRSWHDFEKEHIKLQAVCTHPAIVNLARHGLICIEMTVGSGQVLIAEEGHQINARFSCLRECQLSIEEVLQACTEIDPSVFVLALQGLCDILESSDQPYRGWCNHLPALKQLLRKWRCESPFSPYGALRVLKTLKSLTIFKKFGVPLFIDNYGNKELLRNHVTVDIRDIDKDIPIYHVTHQPEAEKIWEEKCLEPSDNKNMIAGTWFGIDPGPSIYGSRAFKTTLGKLGVQVLRQGEIVSYKQEVNVILYAGRWDGTPHAWNLKAPFVPDPKYVPNPKYVKISIFVPSEFLPNCDTFCTVFDPPVEVYHSGFCVKEKRNFGAFKCPELTNLSPFYLAI